MSKTSCKKNTYNFFHHLCILLYVAYWYCVGFCSCIAHGILPTASTDELCVRILVGQNNTTQLCHTIWKDLPRTGLYASPYSSTYCSTSTWWLHLILILDIYYCFFLIWISNKLSVPVSVACILNFIQFWWFVHGVWFLQIRV